MTPTNPFSMPESPGPRINFLASGFKHTIKSKFLGNHGSTTSLNTDATYHVSSRLCRCASHTRKRWLRSACYEFFEEEPVIQQLSNEAMFIEMHGIEPQNENEIAVSGGCEQPVWKKNIIMGEKCQMPDFSGVILYDSEGQLVAPAKPPRALLTWK